MLCSPPASELQQCARPLRVAGVPHPRCPRHHQCDSAGSSVEQHLHRGQCPGREVSPATTRVQRTAGRGEARVAAWSHACVCVCVCEGQHCVLCMTGYTPVTCALLVCVPVCRRDMFVSSQNGLLPCVHRSDVSTTFPPLCF